MVKRVYTDGSSVLRVHQVIKILDKDAVEEYGRLQVPGRTEILRTITPDGRMLEPTDAEDSDMFNMPGLDVGCFVEQCFTIREEASLGRPLDTGAFYFQDVDCRQPFLFSQYVIALPAETGITEEIRHPGMFEREVVKDGGDVIYVFTAKETPVAEEEILMPPMEEAFPNVNFIQYRNWTEAAQILANIHYPDIIITAELRDKAAEITAGMKGGLE